MRRNFYGLASVRGERKKQVSLTEKACTVLSCTGFFYRLRKMMVIDKSTL